MYQYGLGTAEDLSEAVKWFSLAAEQEHKFALYSLGMLYLYGKGVEQDEEKACMFFYAPITGEIPMPPMSWENCMRQGGGQKEIRRKQKAVTGWRF